MNRRDFLKTAVLALSALALPKLPALKPKPALAWRAAAFPETLMGGPVRWEETADGWSCVDVEPPPGYIRQQGVLVDGPRNPLTLMGYPVVAVEHLPGQVIVTVDSTDYTEPPPVVIVQ